MILLIGNKCRVNSNLAPDFARLQTAGDVMNKKDKQPGLSALSMATTLGFTLVGNIAVGIFLGRLLDNWLGCAPWASVAGIVLGMIAGLWAIYKKAVKW